MHSCLHYMYTKYSTDFSHSEEFFLKCEQILKDFKITKKFNFQVFVDCCNLLNFIDKTYFQQDFYE